MKKELKEKLTTIEERYNAWLGARSKRDGVLVTNVKMYHSLYDEDKVRAGIKDKNKRALVTDEWLHEFVYGEYGLVSDECRWMSENLRNNDHNNEDVEIVEKESELDGYFYGRSGGWFGITKWPYFEDVFADVCEAREIWIDDPREDASTYYSEKDVEDMLARVEKYQRAIESLEEFYTGWASSLEFTDHIIGWVNDATIETDCKQYLTQ